jgi:hypothetical protein
MLNKLSQGGPDALQTFASLLDKTTSCNLDLPAEDDQILHACPNESCNGMIIADDAKMQQALFNRTDNNPKILKCTDCANQFGAQFLVTNMFKKGYERYDLGDAPIVNQEIDTEELLRHEWTRASASLSSGEQRHGQDPARQRLLKAVRQYSRQAHRGAHTGGCFKCGKFTKGQDKAKPRSAVPCRYHAPWEVVGETAATLVIDDDVERQDPVVEIKQKRTPPNAWLASSCPPLGRVMDCNNFVTYVRNQQLVFYFGSYLSKAKRENSKAYADALLKFHTYIEQQLAKYDPSSVALDDQARSEFSLGLGRLLCLVRAHTNGEEVGSPLAAYLLLQNAMFMFSYGTVRLPLAQGVAYLAQEEINGSLSRDGVFTASIHDYVFRPAGREHLGWYWYLEECEIGRGALADKKEEETEGSSDMELSAEDMVNVTVLNMKEEANVAYCQVRRDNQVSVCKISGVLPKMGFLRCV